MKKCQRYLKLTPKKSLIVAYVTYYTITLMLDLTEELPNNEGISFQKLSKKVVGENTKTILKIALCASQLFLCIGQLMLIKNFYNDVLCEGSDWPLCQHPFFMMITCALIFIPLSAITNVHFLHISSTVAACCGIIGLLGQIIYDFEVLSQTGGFG